MSSPSTLDDQILKLQDEAREHQAIALGKRIEIAQLKGQPKRVERYKRQMYSVVKARYEARFGPVDTKAPCFFATAGEIDGATPHA